MKSITLKQRRFLIVWICINAFALFVNVARIRGKIREFEENYVYSPHNVNGSIAQYESEISSTEINLFTNGSGIDEDYSFFRPSTFYPFTTKFISRRSSNEHRVLYSAQADNFQGIFNGYSYLEFIVYILLGFTIVFFPKLWGKSTPK